MQESKQKMRPLKNQSESQPEWQEKFVGIDPNKYADTLIQEAIKAVPNAIANNASLADGFRSYTLNIENLEIVCIANGWLSDVDIDDYKNQIKTYIKNNNLENWSKDPVEGAKVSKEKLKYLLSSILGKKAITGNLEI